MNSTNNISWPHKILDPPKTNFGFNSSSFFAFSVFRKLFFSYFDNRLLIPFKFIDCLFDANEIQFFIRSPHNNSGLTFTFVLRSIRAIFSKCIFLSISISDTYIFWQKFIKSTSFIFFEYSVSNVLFINDLNVLNVSFSELFRGFSEKFKSFNLILSRILLRSLVIFLDDSVVVIKMGVALL